MSTKSKEFASSSGVEIGLELGVELGVERWLPHGHEAGPRSGGLAAKTRAMFPKTIASSIARMVPPTIAPTIAAVIATFALACGGSSEDETPPGVADAGSGVFDAALLDGAQGGLDASDSGAGSALDSGPEDAHTAGGGDGGSGIDAASDRSDAGLADAASDAGSADGAVPVRHLVEVKLFGEMPLDNLVLNPQFDPYAGSWFALDMSASGAIMARTNHRSFARTPRAQPVLRIPIRSSGSTMTVLLGSVMASRPPLVASAWLGRDVADGARLEDVQPMLWMTRSDTAEDASFDLEIDASTPPLTFDGIVWRRFSGTIQMASVGIMTFAVADRTTRPLYVHAPEVVGRTHLRSAVSSLRSRVLTRDEQEASRAMVKWRHRRLGERHDPRAEWVPPKLPVPRAARQRPISDSQSSIDRMRR